MGSRLTKVVHVITGLSDGGAEAVLYRLCTTSTHCQHLVISLMDGGIYGRRLREFGISVYALDLPRGRITPRGLFRLWRLLRRERPDLLQTWMYHADLLGGLVARLAGVRAVCWGIRHSNLEPGRSKGSTILIARLCARLSRLVPQRIVCCAERAATVHQALGYDASRFAIIPNGYDVSFFRPVAQAGQQLRETLGLATNRPVIGLVARFDPQKDHANLIAALARVRLAGWEIETLLVGTDVVPENAILTDLINAASLQESVHLLGRRDDIPALMNALDLHVLSSSFGEAFPNVLAEAMACGTPCVTTDVGDAALIVGETGWVVPPGDPDALAGAILQALCERQNAERWAARKAAARERIVTKFSLDTMVKAYEDVWRSCLEP